MLTNEIYIFLIILILFLALLFSLFIYLLLRKAKEIANRRGIETYKEKSKEAMFEYLYKGVESEALIPKNQLHYIAMEELLRGFADVLDGGDSDQRINAFATKYFSNQYKRDLFHRRWSIRMNTLYMIEDFHMSALLPDVVHFYETTDVTKSEEAQIIKLCAKFEQDNLIDYLKQLNHHQSEITLRIVYSNMSKQSIDEVTKRYNELPLLLQLTFIDIIGILNLVEYGRFLTELLSHSEQEIRIRSLKAIAQIGYLIDVEQLEPHFKSNIWVERMMAAKVGGMVRKDKCLEYLVDLMEDRNFSVRSQAAESILHYPKGMQTLKKIKEESKDSFARDMATDWLERGVEFDVR
ncbi:HEAT repeat domain-containing protein [Bacillus timonensis]|nr:HEAT repeat domain-containing protein [Bacillus timonensis]